MAQRFVLLLITLSLIQCKSTQTFEKSINQENCEAALEAVPENQMTYRLVSKSQEISGTVLSYAAVGSAYTIQLIWDVTATVGAVVVLCSPTILVGFAATTGTGPIQPLCFPGDVKKVQAPRLGKNTVKNTENWNCPDVDGISQSIRKVAQCYRRRGGNENLQKAFTNLKSVQNSSTFYRCISQTEREDFLSDLQNISESLKIR